MRPILIRLFDLLLASLGLVVGAPLLLVLALLGWLDTRSPLFRQVRVGRRQQPFTLVKFRTMRVGTASVATHLASSGAVTRFGHFLRRSKLDELPQLWNVLKGEMSLVGPRPCLPGQHELIQAREALGVFSARPGITGLAQVQRIDMSTPDKLARTDARMLNTLCLSDYFRYLLQTLTGKGRGDQIVPPPRSEYAVSAMIAPATSGHSPHSGLNPPQEIRSLNTLRGLAALIVVVSHYSNRTGLLGGALGQGAGQFGVMLFFLLSGFLMAYLYLGQPFNRQTVYRFCIARVARVVPLFLLVVFFSWLLWQFGLKDYLYRITDTPDLLSHLFLLKGTSVLWTIAPELQFYLVFILCWGFFQRYPDYFYPVAGLLLVGLVFMKFPTFESSGWGMEVSFRLPGVLHYFLVGMLLGRLFSATTFQGRSKLALLSILLLPLLFPNVYHLLTNSDIFYTQAGETGVQHAYMWEDIGVLLVMAFVFYCLVFLTPANSKVLNNPIGDFLGKISYSLYLLHIPVLQWMAVALRQQPGEYFFLYLAVCLGVASVSYGLIEKPARLWIRRSSTHAGSMIKK